MKSSPFPLLGYLSRCYESFMITELHFQQIGWMKHRVIVAKKDYFCYFDPIGWMKRRTIDGQPFINGIIKCMGRKTLLISWISVNFCTTSRNDQIGLRWEQSTMTQYSAWLHRLNTNCSEKVRLRQHEERMDVWSFLIGWFIILGFLICCRSDFHNDVTHYAGWSRKIRQNWLIFTDN